jgi:hypothetical protein
MRPTHCFASALPIKSTSNFCREWLEVVQKALILSEPRHSAVHASWNNATFLTIVSG